MSISAPTVILRHPRATPPQREFWSSPAKFRLFVGGIGSGKTRAGAVEVLRQPAGSTGMVLAPTYPMLRDATLRTFLELTQKGGVLAEFRKAEMAAELWNGTTVLFRSSDNPDRLRGPNLGWFWLDEAAMMDHEAWLIMIGRLRELPGRAWVTTTPKGKNWLYKEFVANGDHHHATVKARTGSNTYLPPDFLASLQATYGDLFARQELEGDWIDDDADYLLREWWVERMADPGIVETCERLRQQGQGGRRVMAADLALGTGRDRTVILVRDRLGILDYHESPYTGIGAAAHVIADKARQWAIDAEAIVYDAGGPGRDLPRYLEQHRIEATPYHGSSSGGPRFKNRRSRVAWRLRQRLDPERPVELPPDPVDDNDPWKPPPQPVESKVQPPFACPAKWLNQQAREELTGLRYAMDGPKVVLENKDDFMARLGRSPDWADAMLMSWAVED